jgi:hypothetical protein
MRPNQVDVGKKVRVSDGHRIPTRRGLVGRVVGRYGGEEYMAADVRLASGECRLFWPEDLEEISSRRPPSSRWWWRSLLGNDGGYRCGEDARGEGREV